MITKDLTPASSSLFFWQIEDEANVDKRRAEMGYEPLAELAKRYKVSYIPYAERAATETQAKPEAKKF